MSRKTTTMIFGVLIVFAAGMASYARQHDHAAETKSVQTVAAAEQNPDIFCATMKTGQLCTHGTSANLGLSSEKQEQWTEIARKYNKAVDAATLQLFKDSEGVLTPQQLTQLKAWFAVGLNPQINEILLKKGLGLQKR